MISPSIGRALQHHIPAIGDINSKSPLAYRLSRGTVPIVNAIQMGVAEAYVNGLEVPDAALRSLFETCMPIFFKYFPSLLAPYDWVLTETDRKSVV